MKTLKLILNQDKESEKTIGLVRLVKNLPDHEFVFHVNRCNRFSFRRTHDIILYGNYYNYHFPRFEAYSRDQKTCIWLIANKCSESHQKLPISELFNTEKEYRTLIEEMSDSDYILTTSDAIHDFSLILLPENLTFQIQEFSLYPNDERYHLIQYYE